MTMELATRALLVVALAASGALAQVAAPVRPLVTASTPARPALRSPQSPVVSVTDLPLTEVPTTGKGTYLAVFLSGDGGWVTVDKEVSKVLAERGIPVVGVNSRAYLWNGKTPEQTGADLARIIAAYRARWQRDSVVIIGYSRGAGIAPFAVNRLPADVRGRVTTVVLIGAEHGAGFHFHLRDLVRTGLAADDVLVLPELRSLGATRVVCFYGADEDDTLCPELAPPAIVVKMKGGHHLDGEYVTIGQRIVSEIVK